MAGDSTSAYSRYIERRTPLKAYGSLGISRVFVRLIRPFMHIVFSRADSSPVVLRLASPRRPLSKNVRLSIRRAGPRRRSSSGADAERVCSWRRWTGRWSCAGLRAWARRPLIRPRGGEGHRHPQGRILSELLLIHAELLLRSRHPAGPEGTTLLDWEGPGTRAGQAKRGVDGASTRASWRADAAVRCAHPPSSHSVCSHIPTPRSGVLFQHPRPRPRGEPHSAVILPARDSSPHSPDRSQ